MTTPNVNLEQFRGQCTTQYGPHTCILIQNGTTNFQMHFLDKHTETSLVNKTDFYYIIPNLLQNKYTVVVIEIQTPFKHEITAIHMPKQTHLTIPPLIQ